MSHPAPVPPDEPQRLERLRALAVLDSAPEPIFDTLARMASAACGMPVALVSLVDAERQWFKSNVGLPGVRETPRDVAFCAHAVLGDDVLEVPDATLDARFAANPLVAGAPDIRFYAGAPITMEGGERVGTLCVIDHRPRRLDAAQHDLLRGLAAVAAQALALRERTLDRALAVRSGVESGLAGDVALLDSVLTALPTAVASFGPDLRLRYANPPCLAWLAGDRRSLLGHPFATLVGHTTADKARRRVDAVLAGRAQSFDARLTLPGRGACDLRIQLIPNRRPGTGSDGFVVLAADMSEERRLQQLAGRLSAIVEASHDAIIGSDLGGTITHWNASAEQMFGYSPAEALGRPLAMLQAPDRPDAAVPGTASLPRAGQPVRTQRLRKDGTAVQVSTTVSPIRDAAGRLVGASKIVRDIGDHVRAEAALARSEARYRMLVEDQTELISVARPDGTLTFVNTAYAAHFGRRPDHMIGTSLYDAIPATDRAMVAGRLRATLDTDGAVAGENLTVAADGGRRWVAWSNRAAVDAVGDVEIHSVGRDITDLKTAEAALKTSEQKFRLLSEASPFGVFHTDAAGATTYANAQWERIYGLSAAEALGSGWTRALHPDDRERVFGDWQRNVAAGGDCTMEFRVRRPDGDVRHVRGRARMLAADDGTPDGFVGAIEDVTEQREALQRLHDSEALLDRTGRIAGVGGWQLDLRCGRLDWSVQTRRIHEVPDDFRPTLESAVAFYPPETRPAIERAVREGIDRGTPWDLELPLVTHTGRDIWIRSVGHAEVENGRPVRLVGAFQDIDLRKRAERALAQSHELLRVTLQSIGDAVITTDAEGRVEWLNPVAERMTGWPAAEAHGRALAQVFHIVDERTRKPAESPVARCLAQDLAVEPQHHTLLMSRDGTEYGIEESVAPIRNDVGAVLGVVLVFHDVTEQRRLSSEMSWRVKHDALTGLVNRAEFEARLSRIVTQAQQGDGVSALMFIDLDQFKLVNDACGHAMGDRLLCQVSALLRNRVRSRDTLARLGGDEFGVLLENCNVEQAMRVAQEICDQMEQFRFIHDGRRFRIGASIGLVPVDRRWSAAAAAMQAADSACYAAKDAGRNRVHAWFDTDLAMRARDGQTQWASRLAQALDQGRFRLHAQRIAPIGPDAGGLHCEVLLRLCEDDGRLVLPGAFLPAAERFHMAARIDRWVVGRVFGLLSSGDPALGRLDTLTVNLSGQSVGDRAFHDHVADLAARMPIDTRKLCFEITETAAVTSLAEAADFASAMRALGVRIALDDFGAGASSFGYLKTLAVDYLKIDGRFVRDLLDDPLDHAAVRSFCEVAKVVGTRTIAKSVERGETLAELRTIGIDFAQGWLVHRPEPLDDMLRRAAMAA